MGDFARYIAIADTIALFLSVVAVWALNEAAFARMPKSVRYVGGAVLAFLAFTVVTVVINAASGAAQTDGVKVFAYVATPVALVAVAGVVMSALHTQTEAERREAMVVRNAVTIGDAIAHLSHAEPCFNPECHVIRTGLLELIGMPEPDRP